GTLYLYFDSKDALFREMVRARVVSCVIAVEDLVRNHQGSVRELVAKLAHQMWATVRDPARARIIRLVHSELGNFPELARFYFDEVILRSRRVFEAVIQRGIEAGEFRRVDPRAAARALPLLLVHSAQSQCFFRDYDPTIPPDEQLFAGLLDLFLNGVLAQPRATKA
ncbi:MAG: TetR-like C-terminal domain-containing protein, partial [Gemmatimonadales bacterium]